LLQTQRNLHKVALDEAIEEHCAAKPPVLGLSSSKLSRN
jgi:hypothetical protein